MRLILESTKSRGFDGGGSAPAAVVRHGRVKVDPAREAVALQGPEESHDAADVQPEMSSIYVVSSGCGALLKPRQHVICGVLVSEKQEGAGDVQ